MNFKTLWLSALAALACGASAQVSTYYLTAGDQGTNWAAQGGPALFSFGQSAGGGEYPIAVSGDIRTTGPGPGGPGGQYDLGGNFTGTSYTGSLPGSYWDGTTDGRNNYGVDWGVGGVYSTARDWSGATLMFTPTMSSQYLGITYDTSDDGLWISSWGTGSIEHYTKSGTLISAFNSGLFNVTCLAYDPADGTLWMQEWGDFGHYQQFDRFGTKLSDVFYAMAGQNTLGGEFNIVPEPASMLALGAGLLALARRRRPR